MSPQMSGIQTFLSPFLVSNVRSNGKLDFPQTSLLEHVVEKRNALSVDASVRFAKLAFTYEEWGLFESLAGQLIHFLQVTHAKLFASVSVLLKQR